MTFDVWRSYEEDLGEVLRESLNRLVSLMIEGRSDQVVKALKPTSTVSMGPREQCISHLSTNTTLHSTTPNSGN